jgi:hypothetical protein
MAHNDSVNKLGDYILFKKRFRDSPPQVMGKMSNQQFVDQVDGPEDPVDEQ